MMKTLSVDIPKKGEKTESSLTPGGPGSPTLTYEVLMTTASSTSGVDALANSENNLESNDGILSNGNVGSIRSTRHRDDYIDWDEYFMGVARLSSMRSKDPNTQVGACIVNPDKKIVGIGYNGMPRGYKSDQKLYNQLPWDRTGPFVDTKYAYVCHAEMNAIMNKNGSDLRDCTIYVDMFPCNECAKLIIQSGIGTVVYMSDKYADQPSFIASRRLLTMAGVEIVHFVPKKESITIHFK